MLDLRHVSVGLTSLYWHSAHPDGIPSKIESKDPPLLCCSADLRLMYQLHQRHNRLSTAWVQLTQSLYQRLLMWYTGLPVRQSQSSNLFSLVQSKGKRKRGSLAITRESWEEGSDWSKSYPVQFREVVFSLKIRTQTALWYQTQLIWEVGWVVPNFNKNRWQAVMSLQFAEVTVVCKDMTTCQRFFLELGTTHPTS